MLSSLSNLPEVLLLSALLAFPTNALPQAGFIEQVGEAVDVIFRPTNPVRNGTTPSVTVPPVATPTNVTTIPSAIPIIPTNPTNLTNPAAGSNTTTPKNLVFAHHIVGNTYNYTVQTWQNGKPSPSLIRTLTNDG